MEGTTPEAAPAAGAPSPGDSVAEHAAHEKHHAGPSLGEGDGQELSGGLEGGLRRSGDGGGSGASDAAAAGDAKGTKRAADLRKVLRRSLALVMLSVGVDMLGIGLIWPVLPFYGIEFNASPFEISLFFAVYALMQAIASPISGRLSDSFGRKLLLLCSLGGSAAGFLFAALSETYGWFLFARALGGVCGSSMPIAMAYVADVTTVEERPKVMGQLMSVVGLSFLLGPVIGAVLAQVSLGTPMFCSAGLAGLGLLASIVLLKDPKDLIAAHEAEEHSALAVNKPEGTADVAKAVAHDSAPVPREPDDMESKTAVSEPEREVDGDSGSTRSQAVVAAKDPDVVGTADRSPVVGNAEMTEEEKGMALGYTVRIAAGEFFNMSAFTAIMTMIGIYVEEVFNFEPGHLGLLFALQSLTFIIANLTAFPRAVATCGTATAGIMGQIIFSSGLLIIALCEDLLPFLLLAICFTGCGYALGAASLPNLMSRHNEKTKQGSRIGIGQAMQALARVVMPAVFGVLYEVDRRVPFYGGIVCCVVTTCLLLDVLQRAKRFERRMGGESKTMANPTATTTATATAEVGAASAAAVDLELGTETPGLGAAAETTPAHGIDSTTAGSAADADDSTRGSGVAVAAERDDSAAASNPPESAATGAGASPDGETGIELSSHAKLGGAPAADTDGTPNHAPLAADGLEPTTTTT